MRHFYRTLLLVACISTISACVTQRKKDEAKGLSLFFHNLNSKYNGFFNATVLMSDANEKLVAQHLDNYNKILDVYPAVAVENPQSVAPDLDKAIEKAAVIATYHRPSHWVDDCYLLLGKAQHLKHDYQAAEESLGYLVEMYDPNLKRKNNRKLTKAEAVEVAKDKKQAKEEAARTKKEELALIAKETKEAKDAAKRDREALAAKDKEELQKLNEERKKEVKNKQLSREAAAAEATKARESRNEDRRKVNEDRRIANQKERERKVQAVREGKVRRKDEPAEPTVKEEKVVEKEDKKKVEPADKIVKSGNNSTPVVKAETKQPKSKIKPKSYFLRHRPCHQEGVLWLARTYTERQNYSDAELLLDNLDKNPRTFKDIRAQVAVAKANLFLKQKNYEMAIPALEKALKSSGKRKEKARLAFILAQLYAQTEGNGDKAFAMFDKVLGYGPAYEMEFNARLNMALTSTTSSEGTTAMLEKMRKNGKNKEYADQINFALAQIALKNGKKSDALDYLKKSLAAGGRNQQQKIEAYYELAKLEYEQEDYVAAKAYYDSTLAIMPNSDNRKLEVERYTYNLVDIAKNLQIIALQDSLIRIAGMTDKQKKDLATAIKKRKEDLNRPVAPVGNGGNFPPSANNVKSAFFGYASADILKKGKQNFEKKWGNDRKLEDNWRRVNKKGGNADIQTNNEIVIGGLSEREIGEILKDVPKTATDIEAAKALVNDALFQVGTLYHDKLKNDKKAVQSLESHLARFPANKHELEDFYYLYLAHNELNNKEKAKEYYDKLQEKYPTSPYAQALKDPESLKKKDVVLVEKYYEQTYEVFRKGDYKMTAERIATSITTYGINNLFRARFALLSAMCAGHLKGRDEYISGLKDIIAKFAGTPEEKRAKEILRVLEYGTPLTEAPKNVEKIDSGLFRTDDNNYHYVLIILPKEASTDDAKVAASDYNSKYARLENLAVSSITLNTETEVQAIVLRKFKDKAAALNYTEGVAKNASDFIKGTKYEVFGVTQDNYREILKQRSVESYRVFYEKNYKK